MAPRKVAKPKRTAAYYRKNPKAREVKKNTTRNIIKLKSVKSIVLICSVSVVSVVLLVRAVKMCRIRRVAVLRWKILLRIVLGTGAKNETSSAYSSTKIA